MAEVRRTRSVTVAAVARRARVSAMTVSRVINGTGYVTPATRGRVERAIDDLGYVPNLLARSLVVRRLGLLGLVVADITHPWFTSLAHSIEAEAYERSFTVIVSNTDDRVDRERMLLAKLSALRVDGVVLSPASDASAGNVRLLQRQGIPFVLVDRAIPGVDADVVRGESYAAARLVTDHLIGHGHSRMAVIAGPADVTTAQERVQGFLDAAGGAHVAKPAVIHGRFTQEAGHAHGRELLRRRNRPTAILAANSFIAFGILRAARELGVRVPDDLALACFDDAEVGAVEPFLTCVNQPARDIGRHALRALCRRLEGSDAPPEEVLLPGTLRIRRSCGCTPERDR
jgi:LacI family transcriptional regulator